MKEKAIMQIGLLIMGISFLCFGIYRCEVDTVLGKAVKLCLECVGIG